MKYLGLNCSGMISLGEDRGDGGHITPLTHLISALGSFSFSPLPHTNMIFYGVTGGFTRLIMKTKYVCHNLISPYVNFHNN